MNFAIIDVHFVKELGLKSQSALEAGDLRDFAALMAVHWEHKKKRSSGMSMAGLREVRFRFDSEGTKVLAA